MGNIFTQLATLTQEQIDEAAFVIPQNEGTETDGQYSRLLRTIFDEEGYENIDIISPYWEDLLCEKEYVFDEIILCLLAGDIVWCAPQSSRQQYVDKMLESIKNQEFNLSQLKKIGQEVVAQLEQTPLTKRFLL